MYKAIITFRDKQDNGYMYNAGDIYPRDGIMVDAARTAELAGSDNAIGRPLIAEIKSHKAAEQAVEAANEERVEIPVEEQKPVRSRQRSRKKG